MCNLSPHRFTCQPSGVLHFNLTCPLPETWHEFHLRVPPKIHLTEVPHLPYITPTQNCTKSPHNSQNHFDNHFDITSRYPSTTLYNKLSDNYKIHPNLPKSEKYTTLTLSYLPFTTALHPKTVP